MRHECASWLHRPDIPITVDWALNINYMYMSAIVARPFFNRNKVFVFYLPERMKEIQEPKLCEHKNTNSGQNLICS